MKSNNSRRNFIKKTAFSVVALQAMAITNSYAFGSKSNKKIYLNPKSDLAVITAANYLSALIGATVVNQLHTGKIEADDIVFTVGDQVHNYSEAKSLLPSPIVDNEWELVKEMNSGMLFSGSSSRNLCHAVLVWMENPVHETNRYSSYRFEERYTMWDSSLNQWYRMSKGFDREQHVYDISRLGFTGMEINRYADAEGYHVKHRKFPKDSYAWYMSYAPALDAFVESSLTEGIYPQEELKANMADLKVAADLSRKFGLKPGFVCYEPRGVAHEVFDRHPELRGARIDHPGRSLEPRYSLDIAHPKVLKHYAESITKLMEVVPDLSYFVFYTQDSGSGMPFSRRLYAGPNGSYLARSKTLGRLAADFISAILDAGRKINPEFEVIMKMEDWEYRDEERKEMAAMLPEGSTMVHIFGEGSIKGSKVEDEEYFVTEGRAIGIEPYAAVWASASWETEPIIGINRPSILRDKILALEKFDMKKIFAMGGIFSKSICPYNVTQELFLELIRNDVDDLDRFLMATAMRWCKDNKKAAKSLVEAWDIADESLEAWPQLNWYHVGAGATQGRWLVRPLVPDNTLLTDEEKLAWQRELFTLPWDNGRKNICFEGGIRMYTEEQLSGAITAFDIGMIPKLKEAIAVLDKVLNSRSPQVILDQRDRYLGFLYRSISTRNLFVCQLAINNYILKTGSPDSQKQLIKEATLAEIENSKNWIKLLKESKIYFFRLTKERETPFQYKTPIADFELKIKVMESHMNDTPGPYLKELFEEWTWKNLKFY